MLCADSLSPCEPWEAEWDSGVKVSCLPTCLSALSNCTTLRVTGADYGDCDGDYDRMHTIPIPDMPAYKKREAKRYLFSSGTQWVISHKNGGGAYLMSGGERC